jgi:hypothetical protein
MSKPSRKLALKKETLRALDADQLSQVGGGWELDWYIMRQPTRTGPTGTEPGYFNYYFLY